MEFQSILEHAVRDERIGACLGAPDAERHAYPWEHLERSMARRGETRLAIASFGALMCSDEGARLLNDPGTFTNGRPVVVFGAKRVFAYEIPDHRFELYGEPPTDDQRAALSAFATGKSTDFFNAVLLTVDLGRLGYLRDRESGYDLCPAVYKAWDSMGDPPRSCFVFSAQGGLDSAVARDDLRPFMPYVDACRRACRSVSEPFERLFLETSFLSDRRTPLSEYLHNA